MGCGCKNKKKAEEAVVVNNNVEEVAVVNETNISEESPREDVSNGVINVE